MHRNEVLKQLSAALPDLQQRYNIRDIAIFGSVARDEARENSDVDVLVEFMPGKTGGYFKFFRLQRELEVLLGTRVDLVTLDGLKHQLRDQILSEAIHAA